MTDKIKSPFLLPLSGFILNSPIYLEAPSRIISEIEKPDYFFLLQRKHWKPLDFAALLIDVDIHELFSLKRRENSLFFCGNVKLKIEEFTKILKFLEASKLFQNADRLVSPKECIQWAKENKISIPVDLEKLLVENLRNQKK